MPLQTGPRPREAWRLWPRPRRFPPLPALAAHTDRRAGNKPARSTAVQTEIASYGPWGMIPSDSKYIVPVTVDAPECHRLRRARAPPLKSLRDLEVRSQKAGVARPVRDARRRARR